MQDIYEIFLGSTVEANFIKTILSENNIEGIINSLEGKNKNTNWLEQNSNAEVSISVLANDFEKAEKLVRGYQDSREKEL